LASSARIRRRTAAAAAGFIPAVTSVIQACTDGLTTVSILVTVPSPRAPCWTYHGGRGSWAVDSRLTFPADGAGWADDSGREGAVVSRRPRASADRPMAVSQSRVGSGPSRLMSSCGANVSIVACRPVVSVLGSTRTPMGISPRAIWVARVGNEARSRSSRAFRKAVRTASPRLLGRDIGPGRPGLPAKVVIRTGGAGRPARMSATRRWT
jgi:hypothetical protein